MNTPTFDAPASPPTPYCCSFHWMRGADGTIYGLDVIYAHYREERGLRLLTISPDGKLTGTVIVKPTANFTTSEYLYRASNYISGRLANITFALTVTPTISKRIIGLPLINSLHADDYLDVTYDGYINTGSASSGSILSSHSIASVHHGKRLTTYGYLTTLAFNPAKPRLLVSATGPDNFRGLPITATYGYGHDTTRHLPKLLFGVGHWSKGRIPLIDGEITILPPVQTFEHKLLNVPTVTIVANAIYQSHSINIDLGRVVLDLRGDNFYIL